MDINRQYQSFNDDYSQREQNIDNHHHCSNIKNRQLELSQYCENSKLIYQKYIPEQNRKYYSTYFYNLRKSATPDLQERLDYNDDDLVFDSKFENGNLFQVFKNQTSERCYDLILQNDINTKGYTQWFYFSVDNCPVDETVELNIINMAKLLKQSKKRQHQHYVYFDSEWKKVISNISYRKNNIYKEGKDDKFYYTMSFKFTFKSKKVYFASNYPYTYQNLNQYLLSKLKNHSNIMMKRLLCTTIAMNDCEYITITSQYPNNHKKGIVFVARQHPGEVTGSFVAEGIIDFLLTDEARELREKVGQLLRIIDCSQYIFKIIPMLNVDGVIHGNQRCSLAGVDLNRKWLLPDYQIHPSVFYAKQLIKQFHEKYKVELLVDLHSHSKKYLMSNLYSKPRLGAFFYGNRNLKGAELYPHVVASINSHIDATNNRFMDVDLQSLRSTARATLGKLLNHSNVYTLECSQVGYMKNNKVCAFTVQDYHDLGVSLCQALQRDTKSVPLPEMVSPINLVDSASDSDPSEDELDPKLFIQRRNRVSLQKKKRERVSLSDCKNWCGSKCRPQTQSQESRNSNLKIQSCKKQAYNFIEKQRQISVEAKPKLPQHQQQFSTCNNSIYMRKKNRVKILDFEQVDLQQQWEQKKEQLKLNTILLQEYPNLLLQKRKRNTFRKFEAYVSQPQKETFSFQQKKVPLRPIINL